MGWVNVKWEGGSTNSYRMGDDGCFDLKRAPGATATPAAMTLPQRADASPSRAPPPPPPSSSASSQDITMAAFLESHGIKEDAAVDIAKFLASEFEAEMSQDFAFLDEGDVDRIIASKDLKKVTAGKVKVAWKQIVGQ